MSVSEEAVEAEVNATGRLTNPKWDHPIMGYKTFSQDQKSYLRDRARAVLEADRADLLRANECTCTMTDPKTWTTYGSAVEPGSMWYPDPDCKAHYPLPTD